MSGFGDAFLNVSRVSSTENRSVADISEFIESSWGLGGTDDTGREGLKLFPVQRVILKAHYGVKLDNKNKNVPVWGPVHRRDGWREGWRRTDERLLTEEDYLKYLFDTGRSNIREVEEGHERRELVLSIGRRSGKTFMSSCVAAYETYKLISKQRPQTYYGMADTANIQLISVATGKEQASLLFNEVSGHFSKCDFFRQYVANQTQSFVRFQTPADIEKHGPYKDHQRPATSTIKVTFSSCVAKGLRGAANIVVILDEFAHFTDGTSSSAKAVYDAVTPSISTFSAKDPKTRLPIDPNSPSEGRVILISSPLGKQGYFYQLFQIGMAGGQAASNMLSIQAPTWEVNPTLPPGEFAKHYAKDPANFFTEYGGEFSDRTRGWLEPAELIACIDKDLRPKKSAPSRMPHYMGIDFALANDASAIAIGHVDENERIVVDVVDKIQAGHGKYEDRERLDFDEVADWVAGYCKRFYIVDGMFDQWAGIPFEQALAKRGLSQLKMVASKPQETSRIFKNFKDMLLDEPWPNKRRLALYNWPLEDKQEYCDYIQELMELQAEVSSKYVIKVEAPQVDGKHDDMSDALVRMVWLASQHLGSHAIAFGRSTGNRMGKRGSLPIQQPSTRAMVTARKKAYLGGSHESRQVPKSRALSGLSIDPTKKKW